jgi:hypothetical protein
MNGRDACHEGYCLQFSDFLDIDRQSLITLPEIHNNFR